MTKSVFIHKQDHQRHGHSTAPLYTSFDRANPEEFNVECDRCRRQEARFLAQQGDYNGAIELLTVLIERYPTSAVDYNNRGLIFFQSGQIIEAIADYNTALRLNPKLDSAYNNRANYYAAVGFLSEAIADYEMALDLNPANVRARINLGITFRQLGQYTQAIDNFDFALHLGKLEGNIYAERGRTYHLRGDWNCAIADYRRALVYLLDSSELDRLRLQVETWMYELLN